MSPRSEFWQVVERIRADDARYAPEAYAFVMEALDVAVRSLPVRGHVSGQQLVAGMCAAAGERFGMLAYAVLEKWGIRSGSDVGEIVFLLVEAGILSRRDEDTREAFDGIGDLRAALEDGYFADGRP